MNESRQLELAELLEALCEDRMTADQCARLEQAVLADPGARRMYVNYISLHGMLHWDAAKGAETITPARAAVASPAAAASRPRSWRYLAAGSASLVTAAVLVVLAAPHLFGPQPPVEDRPVSVDDHLDQDGDNRENLNVDPIVLDGQQNNGENNGDGTANGEIIASNPPDGDAPPPLAADASRSALGVVAFVDEQIADRWQDTGIEPSEHADDAEWVRRVYLDITGHIPSADEVAAFLDDADPDKRRYLVDSLLDHPNASRHFATVWTNLLVGRRAPSAEVNRDGLHAFLESQFRGNRPWSETVTELVSAEGSSRDNGAANFLLAHLNNEAVPATAVTARCFLGMQVQCTQCHAHPFYKDWGQEQFWELNSFFQQTDVVRHTVTDPATNQETFSHLELVSRDVGGPTFYETRNGEMKMALPEFEGIEIDSGPDINRREALARLLTSGTDPQFARAFVNRTWSHFFGYGFTNPVDDMGPHNEVTHPAALDRLADEFVKSGYDVKQLARVICNTQAYQLTSRFSASNGIDAPDLGDPPYFSRAYVRPLTAEQLFDSLMIATRADRSDSYFSEEADARRDEWLAQFFTAEGNDENCESSTFDGTLPQALTMMNGDLVQQAVSGAPGTYLGDVLGGPGDEVEKIRRLSLAVLSRYPTTDELEAIRGHMRTSVRIKTQAGMPPRAAVNESLRDIFWAYLNSSEFIVNH